MEVNLDSDHKLSTDVRGRENSMPYNLKEPFGISKVSGQSRTFNNVLVSALEIEPIPGKAWHNLSSDQSTLSIMLEQKGGRCESRVQLNSPTANQPAGMRHVNYVPAGMAIWGYTDHMQSLRETRLHFDFNAAAAMLGEELNPAEAQVPRLMFASERIATAGEILAAECVHPDKFSQLYGESLIVTLFTDLFRLQKGPASRSRHGPLPPWQMRRVTEFMQERLETPISLSELAALTGLSQSCFGRAFKAATGLSPHQWLVNARIRRAQQMLLEGDRSVSDIALSTGFSEQSHFTRAFRRVVGAPPGEWRRDRIG